MIGLFILILFIFILWVGCIVLDFILSPEDWVDEQDDTEYIPPLDDGLDD